MDEKKDQGSSVNRIDTIRERVVVAEGRQTEFSPRKPHILDLRYMLDLLEEQNGKLMVAVDALTQLDEALMAHAPPGIKTVARLAIERIGNWNH